MSNESGGAEEKSSSDSLTDQFAQRVGQQILDVLLTAGIAMAPTQRRGTIASDLGRLANAFTNIEDPRVRSECLSLIEAISGQANP
jgi:hypothetical protein